MASKVSSFLLVLLLINLILPSALGGVNNKASDSPSSFIYYGAPDVLSYDEMVEVGHSSKLPDALIPKLTSLLETPFLSNESYYSNGAGELSRNDKLGHFIRVGAWNIERGAKLDDIRMAIEDAEQFKRRIKINPDSARYRAVIEQLDALRSVDVLALNEVDLGLKRTGYRDVAREMAAALKMNYAYGIEFIEIDPINLGTEEFKESVDRERYRGLHGTAILSRFPIKSARVVPLSYQPYDWYGQERDRPSIAEAARRRLSRVAFLEETKRQVRFGGRSLLMAEIEIPHLREGSITVVATHLENRCGPRERRRQMHEVLSLIKEIKGPVVLAGDLNTSGSNLMPTSIIGELRKRLKDKAFWIKRAIKTIAPLGLAFDFIFEAASFARTAHDPTSKGLLLFAPNKESDLFKDIERMRFSDGYAFDFRGDASRTVNGTKGTLANSNHRARTKGFITTHSMDRTFWAVGKNKLDWIFVKAYVKMPRGKDEPYRMAPHFARTLEEFNSSLGYRLSDHVPITVDLPVEEPRW